MSFQTSHVREIQPAAIATEPFVFPSVYTRMLQHVIFAIEALVAKITLKRLSIHVRARMSPQIIVIEEIATAYITLVVTLQHMVSFVMLCKLLFGFECLIAGHAFDHARLVTVNFDHMLHLLDISREKLVAICAFISLMICNMHELLVDGQLVFCVKSFGAKLTFENASSVSNEVIPQRSFIDKGDVTFIAFIVSVMHAHVPLHLFETIESPVADYAREDVALKFKRQYVIIDVSMQYFIVFSLQMVHEQFECVNFAGAHYTAE